MRSFFVCCFRLLTTALAGCRPDYPIESIRNPHYQAPVTPDPHYMPPSVADETYAPLPAPPLSAVERQPSR